MPPPPAPEHAATRAMYLLQGKGTEVDVEKGKEMLYNGALESESRLTS